MFMRMKGHNGISPCRMCKILGLRIPGSKATTHYVPLDHSCHPAVEADPDAIQVYDPEDLPLRTHSEIISQGREVEAATTTAEAERLAKKYGVKGVPLLSYLGSISFPRSFPFDFMHLIWENLIKNLILLWTGGFKGLDTGLLHTAHGASETLKGFLGWRLNSPERLTASHVVACLCRPCLTPLHPTKHPTPFDASRCTKVLETPRDKPAAKLFDYSNYKTVENSASRTQSQLLRMVIIRVHAGPYDGCWYPSHGYLMSSSGDLAGVQMYLYVPQAMTDSIFSFFFSF
ncbi:hypothetical protein B0H11DRAFT_1402930 [Mycena galericulata]|nr:hypothetical protein B0H11DRAFT_1402930 [Mycena galericulata]